MKREIILMPKYNLKVKNFEPDLMQTEIHGYLYYWEQ